jgi:hypothetical protein
LSIQDTQRAIDLERRVDLLERKLVIATEQLADLIGEVAGFASTRAPAKPAKETRAG